MILKRFPTEYQMDAMDCGPASLKMVAKYFGRYYSLQYLRDKCGITKEGVSLLGISTAAESIGLHTVAIKCTIADLMIKVPFPVIVHWNENHFVVVYHADKKHVWVSDPIKGHVKYTMQEFRASWYLKDQDKGVLLALEPTSDFKLSKQDKDQVKDSFLSMLRYFIPYKRQFLLIFFVMMVVTLLQAILPFISNGSDRYWY